MSMSLNERNPHVAIIRIGSLASSSTAVVPGIFCRKHSRIKNVYLVDQLGVAKSNSNHVQVQLQDNASSPVAYAALDTSSAAAVANTQLKMALSTTDDSDSDEEDVPTGTMLNVSVATLGTSVLTNAIVIVEHYPL